MTTHLTRFILIVAGLLLGTSVVAGDAADKVTGGYRHAAASPEALVYGKRISAHEAFGRRIQHGFIYIVWPDGHDWSYIDLGDTENACVNVYEDGKARIGGRVTDGREIAIGRWYGWAMEDVGEPGRAQDRTITYRFGSVEDLFYWCESGDATSAMSGGFPHSVVSGNFQVHNFPGDED